MRRATVPDIGDALPATTPRLGVRQVSQPNMPKVAFSAPQDPVAGRLSVSGMEELAGGAPLAARRIATPVAEGPPPSVQWRVNQIVTWIGFDAAQQLFRQHGLDIRLYPEGLAYQETPLLNSTLDALWQFARSGADGSHLR